MAKRRRRRFRMPDQRIPLRWLASSVVGVARLLIFCLGLAAFIVQVWVPE